MSQTILTRGLCAILFSGAFAWLAFSRFDRDVGSEVEDSDRQKYLPYLPSTLLPLCIVTMAAIYIPSFGLRKTAETLIPICFSIFLHISIYYLVLIPLMPLLRKRISSRACAMLWLIPNYLYLTVQNAIGLPKPLVVVHLSGKLFWILLVIWLGGALFVLIRAVWQHLVFRRTILRGAIPVTDPDILSLWQEQLTYARIKKPKYKLCVSKNVTTPLSIGFFNRSIRVVLPDRTYTTEALTLILRHEIVHICRCDSTNKFFIVLCCAMCWFNPLIWLAMRRSADDIELSCDETVLLEADDDTRDQYASLILNTAGDERGFTTCLSASAASLRYRLKHIVTPKIRSSGALVIAIVFFILFMTSGFMTISLGDFTGQAVLFSEETGYIGPEHTIHGMNTTLTYRPPLAMDEEAFDAYIASLPLGKLNSPVSVDNYENYILVFYNGQDRSYALEIKDQILKLTPIGRSNWPKEVYQIRKDVDWEYLATLFTAKHIQDPDSCFPPTLDLITLASPNEYIYGLPGAVTGYTVAGTAQQEEFWWKDADATNLHIQDASQVRIHFSHKVSGTYRVDVTDSRGNLIETYLSSELKEENTLTLQSTPATYTIYATFEDSDSSMDMKFVFATE